MLSSVAAAGSRLRKLRAASSVHFEMPTPERVAQAGTAVVFGSAVRSVEIVRDGKPQTERIRVPRVRVEEDPFTRLASRGQLDPENEDANRWLRAAGERYRALHQKAGLEALQGHDPSKGFTTKRGGGMLSSDMKCDAFDAWTRANRSMSEATRNAVDDLLIFGFALDIIGGKLTSYTDKKIRVAVALTFVRMGLRDLDRHFAEVDRGGRL